MSVLSNIRTTKNKVIALLEKKAEYRDNDEKLVAAFWYNELHNKLHVDTIATTAYQLLEYYANGKLTSADVITRARRKAQEENPELRGANWAKRQQEEKDVRQNINEYPDNYPNM